MPRNNSPAEREPEQTGTSLVVPDDVMQDLLNAQRQSIEGPQALPQIKIMPAGVNLFEFTDTGETKSTFRGVILNIHSRNVLWDHKFGADVPEDERFPACSSADGRYGSPRPNFRHAALEGQAAQGDELIECRTCPYNKWNTGNLLIADKNPKGKAVTNQRVVYILLEDREAPMELVISSTGINPLEEYTANLLNRRVPMQGVVTEFGLATQTKGTMRWSGPTFRNIRNLDQQEFAAALRIRQEYWNSITPPEIMAPSANGLGGIPLDEGEIEDNQGGGVGSDEADDFPF